VARAWAIKELFRDFWAYQAAGWAKRHVERLYSWAIRSRLGPIKAKARMIKTHLPNILIYFKHGISNAVAEGLNSKIQTVNPMQGDIDPSLDLETAFYLTVAVSKWRHESHTNLRRTRFLV